jgi:hypothetical protein
MAVMEMHMPDTNGQGIVRAGRGEEQPADKERAQTATKTEPGHMPEQPVIKREVRTDGKASGFTVTPLQMNQSGAGLRPALLPGTEPVLPERLLRSATSPLNPRTGRRPAD